jgi:hypothetical protein
MYSISARIIRQTLPLSARSLSTTSTMHQRNKKPRLAGPTTVVNGEAGNANGIPTSNGMRRTGKRGAASAARIAPVPTPVAAAPEPVAMNVDATAKSRHFSSRTFQTAPISKESKAGIAHEFMSDVQAATLDVCLLCFLIILPVITRFLSLLPFSSPSP